MINLPFDSPRSPRTAIPGNRDFLVPAGAQRARLFGSLLTITPPGGPGCVASKGLVKSGFGSVAMIGVSRRFFGCVARKGHRRRTSRSCISGGGSPRDFTGAQNADRDAPYPHPPPFCKCGFYRGYGR